MYNYGKFMIKKEKNKKKFFNGKKYGETVIGYTFRVGYIYRADCTVTLTRFKSMSLKVFSQFGLKTKAVWHLPYLPIYPTIHLKFLPFSFKDNRPGKKWVHAFLKRNKEHVVIRKPTNIWRCRAAVSPAQIRGTLTERPPTERPSDI